MARLICPNCERRAECRVLRSGRPLQRSRMAGKRHIRLQLRHRKCDLCGHEWVTAEIAERQLSRLLSVYNAIDNLAMFYEPEEK